MSDPEAQRKEIDGICLFFVLVGVISFFTQMLQVITNTWTVLYSANL